MAYTTNTRQLRRLIQIIEYCSTNYTEPLAVHYILKLDSTIGFRNLTKTIRREGLSQTFSWFGSFEFKPSETGHHCHLMVIVDWSRGLPKKMLLWKFREALCKLKGLRTVEDKTSVVLAHRKQPKNMSKPLLDSNGQKVLYHCLKTEKADAIERFRYLTKTNQKHGVTAQRTTTSRLRLSPTTEVQAV